IGVTEDAHHVLDVRVLGLDGLATIRTRVAAEGDGHIDVAVVDGEGSGIVRASEDRCHVLGWVYAVRVLERHVRELVARSRARIDEGYRLAAQLFEGRDAAIAPHVELRTVRGGSLAYGSEDDGGAVV